MVPNKPEDKNGGIAGHVHRPSWGTQLVIPAGRDLRGLDLSGANLAGFDLKAADLRGVPFQGACLARADLYGADLRHADLSSADLRGANLRLARLEGAVLNGALFQDACLASTWLGDVDLSGAYIDGADFADIYLNGTTVSREQFRTLGRRGVRRLGVVIKEKSIDRPPVDTELVAGPEDAPGGELRGCDLSGVDLSKVDLSGRDLRKTCLAGAKLSGALLIGTDLSEADLSGSDLSDAVLLSAKLSGATMIGANLQCADLGQADLAGVDLTRANLRDTVLCHAGLEKAKLNEADLTGAILTGAWFIAVECRDTIVSGGQLESTAAPQKSIRCPICLHQGVLRDHYVWTRSTHSLLVKPDDDPEHMWPCGHISTAAYRLYFYRPTTSYRKWLVDINLDEVESLASLVRERATDLRGQQEYIPAPPGRGEIEACFDRYFVVAQAKVKLSWAGRPTPIFVAPFAENPNEALRHGWAEVMQLFRDMPNPFGEATHGYSAFEAARHRLIERASVGADPGGWQSRK